ncbi:anthranilate synthase component 2 [Seinonella peptonophila]|uniref:Anthranilate synthase component 2 n=1 Tax=Seinonella peptonophila TaxID=112248 RepID=A0A1M4X9K5_9BACL|nr:aminodeoxychorismate/anthranilate synthase component II [Seinonella peptonophila]SHE90184.1 anthranilate synthase component 2 [Seinonella peptonophila]
MYKLRLLLIDNYDSFTYNLYHMLLELENIELTVKRNDEAFLNDLSNGAYDAVIIGPGPGSPMDPQYFGNCSRVILDYGTSGLPILGVCLGFQGIVHAFGGSIKQAIQPMHGKLSRLQLLKKDTLFKGIDDTPKVMRYHSLMVDLESPFPTDLIITAEVDQTESSVAVNGRELMALEHRQYPIYGVQFHPESFATDDGMKLLTNFIHLCQQQNVSI